MTNFTLDPGAEQRTLLALQRNQLAAERTFLAWVRTGIACIGGGVAFERLLGFQSPVHKSLALFIGILLILLGMGIFLAAYLEYNNECKRFSLYSPDFRVAMGWRRLVLAILWLVSLLFLYLIAV